VPPGTAPAGRRRPCRRSPLNAPAPRTLAKLRGAAQDTQVSGASGQLLAFAEKKPVLERGRAFPCIDARAPPRENARAASRIGERNCIERRPRASAWRWSPSIASEPPPRSAQPCSEPFAVATQTSSDKTRSGFVRCRDTRTGLWPRVVFARGKRKPRAETWASTALTNGRISGPSETPICDCTAASGGNPHVYLGSGKSAAGA
jgi:hypothetical protein